MATHAGQDYPTCAKLWAPMRPSLSTLALHPLLLSAYAVLFLYAENVQLTRPSEAGAPLAWAIAAAAAILGAAWLVVRDAPRAALIASAVVVAFFGYGHLAGLVGVDPATDMAPALVLFVAWVAIVGGVTALLLRAEALPRLTSGLNVIGIVLVVFAGATIVPNLAHQPARAVGAEFTPTGLNPPRATERDIYWIVPDRYGSESSLRIEYGITYNDLPDWLEQRGFELVRQAYANYARTALSMASVLNMTHLDEIAARQGAASNDYRPVYDLLHEHLVGRFLREQGYRYVHIGSWFNPTRTLDIADENLETDSTTEFAAVLHATTALPLLDGLLARGEPMPADDEKHVEHARFQFRAIHRVIDEPGPKFVLLHVLLPHDPYTFDAEGNYRSPAARAELTVAEQFRDQLEYTNSEIKRIVDRLLDRPADEQPIIIIGADEGPYPARYDADQLGFDWSQATPAELEVKFGIINAFYLPPEPDQPAELPEVYPTMTSVNTFRMLFERYFGLHLPYLPDRVYTSASPTRPYDMAEVTDQLPGLAP
jgi:hypothetical protein